MKTFEQEWGGSEQGGDWAVRVSTEAGTGRKGRRTRMVLPQLRESLSLHRPAFLAPAGAIQTDWARARARAFDTDRRS